MLTVYEQGNRGSIDVGELRSMRISRNRGLRPGKQFSDGDIVRLGKCYMAGMPLTDIARKLEVDRRTVDRWVSRLKLRERREEIWRKI